MLSNKVRGRMRVQIRSSRRGEILLFEYDLTLRRLSAMIFIPIPLLPDHLSDTLGNSNALSADEFE